LERGTVKWFHPTKGYGFITPERSEVKDVFVHMSTIRKAGLTTLVEGQRVVFEYGVRDDRVSVTSLSAA
jgi:CspA family cold shock protein